MKTDLSLSQPQSCLQVVACVQGLVHTYVCIVVSKISLLRDLEKIKKRVRAHARASEVGITLFQD